MSLPCLLCSTHVPLDAGFHWPGVHVCHACTDRLGEFLVTQPPQDWEPMFDVATPGPRRGSMEEMMVEEMVRLSDGFDRHDVEEVLEDLRRITAEGGNAAAHADLAMAFADLGMHQEALQQSARVLLLHEDPAATRSALRTVLGPPVLKPRGAARLRQVLFPH